MSVKSKDQTIIDSTDKIIKQLDKNDIDEALKIVKNVRDYMNKRLIKASEDAQELASKLAGEAEKIKPQSNDTTKPQAVKIV